MQRLGRAWLRQFNMAECMCGGKTLELTLAMGNHVINFKQDGFSE